MFKRAGLLLIIFFSFSAIAEIIVPEAVRDQIVADVIEESGYYDAAEIEDRIRLWKLEQPQPRSSGELTESGNCVGSCVQSGGDGSLPKPRNVQFKGKIKDGKFTQNLIIKWKRPESLPEGSNYKLKRYKVILSKDGTTFEKYKVKAKYKNNGKPKRHQKLKLRGLQVGDYQVQVKAIYRDTSSKIKTLGEKASGTESEWSDPTSESIGFDDFTVGDLDRRSALRNCILNGPNPGMAVDEDTLLSNITHIYCQSFDLTDMDIDNATLLTGLLYANITDNPLVTDISELGQIVTLEYLNISKNSQIDLTDLEQQKYYFESLETLIMQEMNIAVIPEFPATVTFIDLSNNKISNNSSNYFPGYPLDTFILDNNQSQSQPTLNDAFFTSMNSVSVFTLKAHNTNVENIESFVGFYNSLGNLDLTGAKFEGIQKLNNFNGFCSLTIQNTEIVELRPEKPIQFLNLNNNSSLKKIKPANHDGYRPIQTSFIGSPQVDCNHYYSVIDNDAPPVQMLESSEGFSCPSINTTASVLADPSCRPSKVADVTVYKDVNSSQRFITWSKNEEHAYDRWGVTHYQITAYDNETVLNQYTRNLNEERSVLDSSSTATHYTIAACINTNCGYEKSSTYFLVKGLGEVQELPEDWAFPLHDSFSIRFTYSNDDFAIPFSRPDRFEITPYENNAPSNSKIIIDVDDINLDVWETGFLNRETYPESSFKVQACKLDFCGPESIISVEDQAPVINLVNELNVYEDVPTRRRYITWKKNANFNYTQSGVTHYQITAYTANGSILNQYFRPIDEPTYIQEDSLAATNYVVQACIDSNCGYKYNDDDFETGLLAPIILDQAWSGDNSSFEILFEYFSNASAEAQPEYFEIRSSFPQTNGEYLIATVSTNSASCATGCSSGLQNRNQVLGSSFSVHACRANMGCSNGNSIAVTQPDPVNPPDLEMPSITSVSVESGTDDPATTEQDESSTTLQLSWTFDDNSEDAKALIDYIKITEVQPKRYENEDVDTSPIENPSSVITYFSHKVDGPIILSRFTKGKYTFSVQACQKSETSDPDTCSNPFGPNNINNSQSDSITLKREDIKNYYLNWAEDQTPRILFKNDTYCLGVNACSQVGDSTQVEALEWDMPKPQDQVEFVPDYFLVKSVAGIIDGINGNTNEPVCIVEEISEDANQIITDKSLTTFKVDAIALTQNNNSYSRWTTKSICKEFKVLNPNPNPNSNPDPDSNEGFGKWTIEACERGVGCGEAIEIYCKSDNEICWNGPQQDGVNSTSSGPGDVKPGSYWNPAIGGTGWYFYWINGLKVTSETGRYDRAYDLVGYWFAYRLIEHVWTPVWYEARLRKVHSINNADNTEGAYLQGDIYYHRRTSSPSNIPAVYEELDVGNIQLKLDCLNCNNSATLVLDVDYSEGFFTPPAIGNGSENIHPYIRTPTGALQLKINDIALDLWNPNKFVQYNDNDHYSGLWQYEVQDSDTAPLSSAKMSMLTSIDGGLENNMFAYYDSDGEPVWLASQTCPQMNINDNGSEPSCVGLVTPDPEVLPPATYFDQFRPAPDDSSKNLAVYAWGFNPLSSVPMGYNREAALKYVGKFGRRFEENQVNVNNANRFNEAKVWIDVNDSISVPIPGSGNYDRDITTDDSLGTTESSMADYVKQANFHGIFYDIAALEDINASECNPNNTGPCDVYVNFYTDDHFLTQPFVRKDGFPYENFGEFAQNSDDVTCDYNEVDIFKRTWLCTFNAAGTYTFQLRKSKYEVDGFYETIAQSKPLKILGCTNGDCSHANIPAPTQVDTDINLTGSLPVTLLSHQVGSGPVPGSGGVSGGAATYHIPLDVPPGRNGMTPDISINYSSKSGDGIMGVGWSLSVGSSIYHCPKTMAQDGQYHIVDYSTKDRLCLDGQRLMLVSATDSDSDYWNVGAEYRTEVDTFTKVVKQSTGMDADLMVYTKSGRVKTYKKLSPSLSNWQLVKEADSFGNFITYRYNEYNGTNQTYGVNEWLLTEIWYTGKDTDTGDRKIRLNYKNEVGSGDLLPAGEVDADLFKVTYQHGIETQRTQLLESVTTHLASSQLRAYEFSYRKSKANNSVLLSSATETATATAGDISRDLIATDWSDLLWDANAEDTYAYSDISTAITSGGNTGLISELLRKVEIKADFNGDGIKEVMASGINGSPNVLDLENNVLIFMDQSGEVKKIIDFEDAGLGQVSVAGYADFNVDGYTDLLLVKNGQCGTSGTSSLVALSWKNDKTIEQSGSIHASVDDFFDQIPLCGFNITQYPHHDNTNVFVDLSKSFFYVHDYNGDGRKDIIMHSIAHESNYEANVPVCALGDPIGTAGCDIYKNRLIGFQNTSSYSNGQIELTFNPIADIFSEDLEPFVNRNNEVSSAHDEYQWDQVEFIDDLNGDGMGDFVLRRKEAVVRDGEIYSALTDLKIGFINEVVENEQPAYRLQPIRLTDLGLTDFNCRYLSQPTVDVSCNNGGDDPVFDSISFKFVDINSDGLQDFVYFDKWIQLSGNPDEVTYQKDYNIVRTWKARLNQGGAVDDLLLTHDLFSDTVYTANDQPSGVDFLPDGAECEDPSSANSLRLCNPFFRSAVQFVDTNNDGDIELLYPEFDMSELYSLSISGPDQTPVTVELPYKLPFNHCGEYDFSFLQSTLNAQSSTALSTGILYDAPMDTNVAPNTDMFADLNQNNPSLQNSTPVTACSYNHDHQITGDQDTIVYDMYKAGPEYSLPQFDMGVYRYNAIEFRTGPQAQLLLEINDDTGIYKRLHTGVIGDMNGDGLVETFSTMGCTPDRNGDEDIQCTQESKDFALNKAAFSSENWSWVNGGFDEDDFFLPHGIATASVRELPAPDLLTQVTKPKTAEYVQWDHYPISYKLENDRFAPLYHLPERGDLSENGYIEDEGAIGTHFFFNSSMYVVSEMRRGTGLVGTGGEIYSTSQYAYEEAVYNNQGRGFQGFRKISVLNQPDSDLPLNMTLSESLFHQVFPLSGKLENVKTYQYINDQTQYILGNTDYTWYPSNQSSSFLSSRGVHFWPLLSKLSKNFIEESSSAVDQNRFSQSDISYNCGGGYDEYGNVLCSTETTDYWTQLGTGNQHSQMKVTTTNNYNNDVSNWWIDKLSSTQVHYHKDAETGMASDDKTVKNLFHWQENNNNLRKLSCQFTLDGDLDVGLYGSCGASPSDTGAIKNSFVYDDYGRIRILTQTGINPLVTDGDNEEDRVTVTEYGNANNTGYFPTKISKGNLVTEKTYNEFTGQVKTSTDANGVVTTITYDDFGFPTSKKVTKDNDQLSEAVTTLMLNCADVVWCDTYEAIVTWAMEDIKNQVNAVDISVNGTPVIFDVDAGSGFYFQGGNIRTPELAYMTISKQEGAPVTTNWLDQHGQVVLTQTDHSGGSTYVLNLVNPLGQTEVTTLPFRLYGSSVEDLYYTFNTYNERGQLAERLTRVGEVSDADTDCWRYTHYDTTRGQTTIKAYVVGTSCTVDENHLNMSRSYDAAGQLRETVDATVEGNKTRYWYDAMGNPKIIQDANDNPITTTYDNLGRKIAVDDLNMGRKVFDYNSFGELIKEQDAEQLGTGLANYLFYDNLGRLTLHYWNVEDTLTPRNDHLAYMDTYVYVGCDSVVSVCNQQRLSSRADQSMFALEQSKQYQYDGFNRLVQESIELSNPLDWYADHSISNPEYTIDYSYYDDHNLLLQTTWSHSGITNQDGGNSFYSVVNEHNAFGDLIKQTRNPDGEVLHNVVSFNWFGAVQELRHDVSRYDEILQGLVDGDNLLSYKSYLSSTRQVDQITNIDSATQQFDYGYDAWGNIKTQMLTGASETHSETFTYDTLQRLSSSSVSNGNQSINYEYDNLGNLKVKDDFASLQTYGAGAAGPNAITQSDLVNSNDYITYQYDVKGNRIADYFTDGDTQTTSLQAEYFYDANNMLVASTKNQQDFSYAQGVSYRYGIDQNRYLKHEITYMPDDAGFETNEATLYAFGGQIEEIIDLETPFDHQIRLQVNDSLQVTLKTGINHFDHHYLFKDRLGSTTLIYDAENSNVVGQKGYDAFGKPRNGVNWSNMGAPALDFDNNNSHSIDITKRGFTGHEHLDAFELIHMNGRMYDFNTGRFLSVDPYIQGSTSQAINPYSYIQNNPLSGVDPTGYLAEKCGEGLSCEDLSKDLKHIEVNKESGEITAVTSSGDRVSLNSAQAGAVVGHIQVTNGGFNPAALGSLAGAAEGAFNKTIADINPRAKGNTSLAQNITDGVKSVIKSAGTSAMLLFSSPLNNSEKSDLFRLKYLSESNEDENGNIRVSSAEIAGVYGNPGGPDPDDEDSMDPYSIRFSQDNIRNTFRDGRSIDELAQGLRSGSVKPQDVPAIRLVRQNGRLITIDNRRLEAFRRAGKPIRTRMATPREIAQAKRQGKFSAGQSGAQNIRVRGGK